MTFVFCLLALGAGFVYLRHRGRRRIEVAVAVFLALTASVAGWRYFRADVVALADGERMQLHIHDFSHYYLGSKYFPELGYQGLYVAVAAALQDLRSNGKIPATDRTRIEAARDLAEKTKRLSAPEIAERADSLRASFTTKRWRAFTDDVGFLVRVRPDYDWRQFVLDSGFNPTPGWTVLASFAAGVLPLDRCLGLAVGLDRVLLLIVGGLLWRFLGAVPALLAATVLFVFPPGDLSTSLFTSGSFLRQTWLVWLGLSWILLGRGRFFLSGALFGLATMERVFPVFFFAGALWSCAGDVWGRVAHGCSVPEKSGVPATGENRPARRHRDATRLLGGFVCGVLALGGLSGAVFGPKSWSDFAGHIRSHSELYFANHIGLQKAGTYTPEIITSFVSSYEAPARFEVWSTALASRWKRWRMNVLLQALLILAAAAAARRLPRVRASAFLGSALLFAFSMPAHYYLIYYSLWAAVLLVPEAPPPSRRPDPPPRELWMYLAFAGAVIAVEALLLGALPLEERIAFSCFALLFFFLATAAGILLRPALALAACCVLLAGGVLLLQTRAAPLSNQAPPPELGGAGQPLVFESAVPPRRTALKTMDAYGYAVDDAGVLLAASDELVAGFSTTAGEAVRFIVRSDQAVPGYLTVTVNRRWQARLWVSHLGALFAYLQVLVPADALLPGANSVGLSWSGPDSLAVFSSWVTRPARGRP